MSDGIIHFWTQVMHRVEYIPGTNWPVASDDRVLCSETLAGGELGIDPEPNFTFKSDDATCPKCRFLLDNYDKPWRWDWRKRKHVSEYRERGGMTKILDIIHELDHDEHERIVALLVGPKVYDQIRSFQPIPHVYQTVMHPKTLLGIQVLSFPDVPDHWITAFYDETVLERYLQLREAYGHTGAIKLLSPHSHVLETLPPPSTPDDS